MKKDYQKKIIIVKILNKKEIKALYLAQRKDSRMKCTLHSPAIYPEIVEHEALNLMTKLTDFALINETALIAKEQDKALRRAWISNTEVKLIERKSKLDIKM
tara:strand:+ start:721 stop:1026 length:306 start_codon:yes stop_codon:yes gene_type:complete